MKRSLLCTALTMLLLLGGQAALAQGTSYFSLDNAAKGQADGAFSRLTRVLDDHAAKYLSNPLRTNAPQTSAIANVADKPKRAAILYEPDLEAQIRKVSEWRISSDILPRLKEEGYEIETGKGDVETITRVLMGGEHTQITFIGHGGREMNDKVLSTLGQKKTAIWWQGHLFEQWQKYYLAKGLNQDEAKKKALERSENFGLDEVINMSCYSLRTTDVAQLFVKPGGNYYGSKEKFTSLPQVPLVCNLQKALLGGQYELNRYEVPPRGSGGGTGSGGGSGVIQDCEDQNREINLRLQEYTRIAFKFKSLEAMPPGDQKEEEAKRLACQMAAAYRKMAEAVAQAKSSGCTVPHQTDPNLMQGIEAQCAAR